jgi:hypothetical protein
MLLLPRSLILLLAVLAGRSVSILLRIILIAIMAGCLGVLFPWITHCPLPAADEPQPNVILKLKSCGEALTEECARPEKLGAQIAVFAKAVYRSKAMAGSGR